MFRKLFNPDNPLMVTMTHITDCIFLSLFWLLCCIPLVTTGAAGAALYDASFRACRQGERNSWQRFGRVFRDNWKAGILPSLVYLAAFAGIIKVLISMWNLAATAAISWVLFSAVAFVLVVVLGILSVMFPVLSRFENSFAGLLKNTLFLALANLPKTILLGLINAISIFLCVRLIAPVFILPSVAALLGSWLIEPMFKPYMKEENAA